MPLSRPTILALIAVVAAALALGAIFTGGADVAPPAGAIPDDLRRLQAAYPAFVAGAAPDRLVLTSGHAVAYQNGGEGRPFEERLGSASLKDQMSIAYPPGREYAIPTGDNDPGRLRHIPLFQAMYGASEAEVRRRLVAVKWLGRGEVWVTEVNGVDKALARVSERIMNLPHDEARCAAPVAGTFAYRAVAGTSYLSAHSFGIAIDLNIGCSDYWYWDKTRSADGAFAYRNRMPLSIVEAFEREGFIWGGKWAHYDTMHFEYRPELLPAR
jgi:hypothetical protein